MAGREKTERERPREREAERERPRERGWEKEAPLFFFLFLWIGGVYRVFSNLFGYWASPLGQVINLVRWSLIYSIMCREFRGNENFGL